MVDINRTANEILSPIKNDGASLCYQYPESFEKLPAVSFFNLLTSEKNSGRIMRRCHSLQGFR